MMSSGGYEEPLWCCAPQILTESQDDSSGWFLEEIKNGIIVTNHDLNRPCTLFGRDADVVHIHTAHESCSRLHARIAFDSNNTPWLRDLKSGNGTLVNKQPLPPQSIGKLESNSQKPGARGIILKIGDIIQFGASTRIYCLNGPTISTAASNTKLQMNQPPSQPTSNSNDNSERKREEEGVSWGMDMTLDYAEDEETDIHMNDSAPLDMEKIDISKIPQKLYERYTKIKYKLTNIQTESERIYAKGELTDGQTKQLERNEIKEKALLQNIQDIEDDIRTHLTSNGSMNDNRSKKNPAKRQNIHVDDDIDDFYDRTIQKNKYDNQDGNDAIETKESLTNRWKHLLLQSNDSSQLVKRINRQRKDIQSLITEIEISPEDETFFLKNDLQLHKEQLQKLLNEKSNIDDEIKSTETLLRIVLNGSSYTSNDNHIVFDRISRQIQMSNNSKTSKIAPTHDNNNDKIASTKSDTTKIVRTNSTIPKEPLNSTGYSDKNSIMPPPRPIILPKRKMGFAQDKNVQSSEDIMPPPNSQTQKQHSSTKTIPIFNPMNHRKDTNDSPLKHEDGMSPPLPRSNSTSDSSKMESCSSQTKVLSSQPPTSSLSMLPPPARKRKKVYGPSRAPPARSTLSSIIPQASSKKKNATSNNNGQVPIFNSDDPKQDTWKAPKDQDGSGITKLNAKFAGRY